MSEHEEDSPQPRFRRWMSVGDMITLAVTVVAFAFGYGSLSKDVDTIKTDVASLKARDITPGAERRIAVLEMQVAQQRIDSQDWRREVREQLDRIEAKVEAHMEARHR